MHCTSEGCSNKEGLIALNLERAEHRRIQRQKYSDFTMAGLIHFFLQRPQQGGYQAQGNYPVNAEERYYQQSHPQQHQPTYFNPYQSVSWQQHQQDPQYLQARASFP